LERSVGLKAELEAEVKVVFKFLWEQHDSNVVPEDTTIKLGNDAVNLRATVLYADTWQTLRSWSISTNLFSRRKFTRPSCIVRERLFAARVITAYDGDRIMAVYLGDSKNTSAVRTALKINYAARMIIAPAKQSQYPDNPYTIKHVVGVDTSELFVAKTGVRGANDLVWVGRAANYAAKLSALPHEYGTYVTKEVYDTMADSVKTSSDGRSMWEAAGSRGAGHGIQCSHLQKQAALIVTCFWQRQFWGRTRLLEWIDSSAKPWSVRISFLTIVGLCDVRGNFRKCAV
jgi:class 3 adenylate cyclase